MNQGDHNKPRWTRSSGSLSSISDTRLQESTAVYTSLFAIISNTRILSIYHKAFTFETTNRVEISLTVMIVLFLSYPLEVWRVAFT